MIESISKVFQAQKLNSLVLRKSSTRDRVKKLQILKKGIEKYEVRIYNALQADLRKCSFETAVTELFFTYAEIDYAIKHLQSWMTPKSVGKNLGNFFSSNKIYYEPKGVCLIMAPWNYPFLLVMSPLISAIAAGNTVVLKPSELSANTSAVIAELISEFFESNEIACFEGDAEIAKELLTLPFDHIFFTGSTQVGKIVMAAAAKNLSSVTLELGGKSPAIIDKSCNLKIAAKKIAWGKLISAGQTCIAPDYVIIEENLQDTFITYYKEACLDMLFKDGKLNTAVYAKIINEKHFKRLQLLLENAIKDGAKLEWGGQINEAELTIYPSILTQVNQNNTIMQDEIFGPLLPVLTVKDINEGIEYINSKNKALALYIFSNDKNVTNKIINETSSGGTCVNDVLVHISNPNLPFGGVNSSGIGSCHGFFGFKNFSHERAVLFQSRLGLTKLIYPPYNKRGWLLKWLKKLM